MSDETNWTEVPGTGGSTQTAAERVGFCQDCGKGLTKDEARAVGGGVFCESCLAVRLGAAAAGPSGTTAGTTSGAAAGPWTTTNYPPPPVNPVQGQVAGVSHPVFAGLLSIIPGVGTIYNGQYAKGLAHLLIFAVLMSLSDHVSIFGLVAFGWYCYQIVDAYHTAKAIGEGLPLPNPFGLNEIGERLGFGKGWGVAASVPTTSRPATGPVPPASVTEPVAAAPPTGEWTPAAGWTTVHNPPPPPGGPVGAGPDWVGYVSPSAFGAPPPPPPYAAPQPSVDQMADTVRSYAHTNWSSGTTPFASPYAETYTGTGTAAAATPPTKGFPASALWLIALGGLFLLSNWVPMWRLNGNWFVAVLFAGIAAWTISRRFGYMGGAPFTGQAFCLLRGPVVMLTLALIFALQGAHIATFGQTWSLLLVATGAMLLLERTVGSIPTAYGAPGYVAPEPVAPPPVQAAPVAETTSNDTEKGGQ